MKRSVLVEIICSLLVLLLVYTGLSKLVHHNRFVFELKLQPIPTSAIIWLSWLLPFTELFIAASLFFYHFRVYGLFAALILMIGFTSYTSLILLNSFKVIPCSCGGIISLMSWKQHLIFNILFVMITFGGFLLQNIIIEDMHAQGMPKTCRKE